MIGFCGNRRKQLLNVISYHSCRLKYYEDGKQWYHNLDFCLYSFYQDKKRCTRLAAASDKVYQLLAHGRWFSPGTPSSSTTKTGRHDIAEILLKVALKHQKSINQNQDIT